MSDTQTCVIIGASHAGVNAAFALKKEGWEGDIVLFDTDATLPYHRPPLSKAHLTSDDGVEKIMLKPEKSYEQNNITLNLGVTVTAIDRDQQTVSLDNGTSQSYSKLILTLGASPIVPPIPGLKEASNVFCMRTSDDTINIKKAMAASDTKRVVIIGGGYIGLETAASLKKMGASVTVLEREERILARVTAPFMSNFFQELHQKNGVDICTGKNVSAIENKDGTTFVSCADGSEFAADIIIVGVGVRVNKELAEAIGIEIDNGIVVDSSARTNDANIYAVGDCTLHHNPHYDRKIRLESVQNAVDQAKTAAAAICGKDVNYNTIPWFWSDQYDVKLQMVGLAQGYDDVVVRKEEDTNKFSVWYFQGSTLLSVDTVNQAKAYVVGTKLIKSGEIIDKTKLADPSVEFKPANILA